MECAGRAQRRRRFGSIPLSAGRGIWGERAKHSDVALRLLPHSKKWLGCESRLEFRSDPLGLGACQLLRLTFKDSDELVRAHISCVLGPLVFSEFAFS